MLSRAELESIHRFSGRNRDVLATRERAGCFYCASLFAPSEITDWVDGPQVETGDTADGVTALCPCCGIDAVLPSASVRLSSELLTEMRACWFSSR
jgi:hypothetical protein